MNDNQATRVWAAINAVARADGVAPTVRHGCVACARQLGGVSVGLSIIAGPAVREPVFATDQHAEELEELQLTLGEGPSWDATADNSPVLVADLDSTESKRRWPIFAPAAVERGAPSLLALPLSAGAAMVGVLNVYRRSANRLLPAEITDALAYADAILVLALDKYGGVSAGRGFSEDVGLAERRAEVHQAAGMVSVQLGVGVTEALARLRAYAFLQDRRLTEIAAEVVARRLGFSPAHNGGGAFYRPGPLAADGATSPTDEPDAEGR